MFSRCPIVSQQLKNQGNIVIFILLLEMAKDAPHANKNLSACRQG